VERLQELRRRRVMSITDLSEVSGVHRNTIHRIERGKPAYTTTIRKLARALEVDPAELVGRTEERAESMEKLTAIYEHTEDGWWVVSVPEIPGAHSQGRTLEEAREMIKDAIRLLLEVRREDAEREASAAGKEVVREPLEV
jgi:predicted RNase H-like HicB family nuclease/DNA-binding Xre family transcriptional regulator